MVRRGWLVVVWGLAAGAMAIMGLAIYEVKRSAAPAAQPVAIERLPPRQNHNPWARWSVTQHFAAHNMLVAHVETDYLHEALAIAQQVIEPSKERYAEVLIYFHRPGRPDTLPPRRVQWTPTNGYVETVYE